MMKFLCFSVLAAVVSADQQCHAISPQATDAWCQSNCNYKPPNCPASLCQCTSPSPTPTPTPTPSPTPPGPTPPTNAVFELDLFMNDPAKGWQSTGFPEYLQKNAKQYTNVAGISFIQPSDLMNDAYDLPTEVGVAVQSLRKQGVTVQLLVGGEISSGWPDLIANPTKAAAKAVELMQKYDCGIEVDNESGGDSAGLIKFIQLCFSGKPSAAHISMDVGGTPSGAQVAVAKGAIDSLDWINLMVSTPSYDQTNSVNFAHADGIPYEKITVAYYAGTWVNNCNDVGTASNTGDLAAGIALFKQFGLKGVSVWAVGGASYANCKTDDAPGFSEALNQLGAQQFGISEVPMLA